jgi:hypothetical protein
MQLSDVIWLSTKELAKTGQRDLRRTRVHLAKLLKEGKVECRKWGNCLQWRLKR